MKINFNREFTNLDGTVIPEQPDEFEEKKDGRKISKKYPPFTLKNACVNILSGAALDELTCPQCGVTLRTPEKLDGEEKCRRFELARKIYGADGEVDIGTKDIELIKELLARTLPTNLIVGQAWAVLDPSGDGEKT